MQKLFHTNFLERGKSIKDWFYMKEYEIKITTVTTVYVDADNEKEALSRAHVEAMRTMPDIKDTVIISVTDLED